MSGPGPSQASQEPNRDEAEEQYKTWAMAEGAAAAVSEPDPILTKRVTTVTLRFTITPDQEDSADLTEVVRDHVVPAAKQALWESGWVLDGSVGITVLAQEEVPVA